MLGLLRGVVRGAFAWLLGWVLTLVAGSVGLLAGGAGFTRAAETYIGAHGVPPDLDLGIAIVVMAVAIGGFRAGQSTRSGVTGRIRSFVQSVRGTERNRARTAAVAGALLAVGYAIVGVAVGLTVGTQAATALVGGLVYGLVVGVPTAVVGALY